MNRDINQLFPFVGMTFVFILLFWLFTHQLALAPQIVVHRDTLVKPNWKAIAPQGQAFTVNVPSGWQEQAEINPDFENINTAVFQANQLFLNADDRLKLELTAYHQTNKGLQPQYNMTIYSSERLNQLDLGQFIQFIRDNEPLYSVVNLEERTWLPDQVSLTGIKLDSPRSYQCEIRFAPGLERAYILTICVEQSAYTVFRSEITTIFDSFQPLEQ